MVVLHMLKIKREKNFLWYLDIMCVNIRYIKEERYCAYTLRGLMPTYDPPPPRPRDLCINKWKFIAKERKPHTHNRQPSSQREHDTGWT